MKTSRRASSCCAGPALPGLYESFLTRMCSGEKVNGRRHVDPCSPRQRSRRQQTSPKYVIIIHPTEADHDFHLLASCVVHARAVHSGQLSTVAQARGCWTFSTLQDMEFFLTGHAQRSTSSRARIPTRNTTAQYEARTTKVGTMEWR